MDMTTTTEQYIALTRALEAVTYVGANGANTISASDIPIAINMITKGKFEMDWARFVTERVHIAFERYDNANKYDEMRAMLASNAKLAEFLRFHMEMTADVFVWNFRE